MENNKYFPQNSFNSFLSAVETARTQEDLIAHQSGLLKSYLDYTSLASKEPTHKEYCDLQMTWNYQVLLHSSHLALGGMINRDRLLSLGSFLGLAEMAYAEIFKEVVCVDQHNFLPSFKPENITFHQADLDSSAWTLPEGRFNICFMIEILEHLFWSPIPLLKSLHACCDMLVITTPDDDEWPPMTIHPYTRYQRFDAIPSAFPGATGNPAPMFHCKQYSQSEFIDLLTFCGFRIVEFRRIGLDSKQMLIICTSRGA
jgi:hypothetical protein